MKSRNTIKAPSPPDDNILEQTIFENLDDETDWENFSVSQCHLTDRDIRFLSFNRVRIVQVLFNNTHLRNLNLCDVRFERCDLSNTLWLKAKLSRIELLNCKLTGFKSDGADGSHCRFQERIGELTQFCNGKFRSSIFEKCQLRGADFRYCDLEGTIFTGCDLKDAEFYDANLRGVDFRNSDLCGIKAHPENLKGAIIDSQQAYSLGRHFASMLGIAVKDESL